MYAARHNIQLQSDDLKITKVEQDPHSQVEQALDDLMREEILNTGLIFSLMSRSIRSPLSVSSPRCWTENSPDPDCTPDVLRFNVLPFNVPRSTGSNEGSPVLPSPVYQRSFGGFVCQTGDGRIIDRETRGC